MNVGGWDTKLDPIGKVGLDRRWLAGRILEDANRDRQESWQGRCRLGLMWGFDEPESALPKVKFRPGDAFLVAELHDGQTTRFLPADAITPNCMQVRVGGSCHGV